MFLSFCLAIPFLVSAQYRCGMEQQLKKSDPRANEYEALHYDLFFDMFDKANSQLHAEAVITLELKADVSEIVLDKKSYNIDTAWTNKFAIQYNQNDSTLKLQKSDATDFTSGDTVHLHIHYSGPTYRESLNFGGFFFRPPYAYNIGVAFREIPHNFGRVWYPCLDYFTSRSTYTTRTLTYGGDVSVSAGNLVIDSIVAGDTLYRVWDLTDPIPTYLHSLSVAPYAKIDWQHQGLTSSFPVELYSLPADTSNLKSSFVNLDSAIRYYEESFYDYVWQKVGYNILPMNGGAMEHATNIAYPSFAIGPGDYEYLMAHELSHHWWGNLVTCDEASEMWLNEGWASFSEYLFMEKRYGWERAREDVMEVLYDVLLNADHDEGGYLPVSGVPEPYIYGTHVYDKGSLVALALREYLGNDFESSIRSFFDQNKFKSINSAYFKSELERISGKNLDDYFDSWVYEGGFVDFFLGENTSLTATEAVLDLKQTLTGTTKEYKNVPLNIRFIYDDESTYDIKVNSSGGQLRVPMTKKAKHVLINPDAKLPLAFTADEKILTNNGPASLSWTELPITAAGITDSSWIRLEQHFSPAYISDQNAANLKVRISKDRHWRLCSMGNTGRSYEATFSYDGRVSARRDADINGVSEDSLLILYKPLYGGQWREWEHYTQNQAANPSDYFGLFELTDMEDGYYAIGIKDPTAGISCNAVEALRVFPNPASDEIKIELRKMGLYQIRVYDLKGASIYEGAFEGIGIKIDVSGWKAGQYLLVLSDMGTTISQKIIVQ